MNAYQSADYNLCHCDCSDLLVKHCILGNTARSTASNIKQFDIFVINIR